MNFLYPQFLFALGFLAIPILIHLFNFRKTRRVYFSTLRFIAAAHLISKAKRKIKHYLILFCRLCALAFLIIAFAQPIKTSKENIIQSNEVFLYLDNSHSMSNELQSGQYGLEEAIDLAQKILNSYPRGTKVRFLDNDFSTFSYRPKSIEKVSDQLTQLTYSGRTRTAEEILSRMQFFYGGGEMPDVFWISDFQEATFGQIKEVKNAYPQMNILPLAFGNTSNVYIDSVYTISPVVNGASKVLIKVVLKNDGVEGVSELPVKLFRNEVQVSTNNLDMSANEAQFLDIDLPLVAGETSKYKVEIEDFPVTFDNQHYFAINPSSKIKVVEIKGATANGNVANAFGNSALYNFTQFGEQNVGFDALVKSDVVVLNEISSVAMALDNVLKAYLQSGGTVYIIPSESGDISSFSNALGHLTIKKQEAEVAMAIDPPNIKDPFFEQVFEGENKNLAQPRATQQFLWSARAKNILTFENGAPFLSYFSSKGHVYIQASSLSSELCDFDKNAIFVPVLYKIAMNHLKMSFPLSFKIDDNLVNLGNIPSEDGALLKLKGEESEIIPNVIKNQKGMSLEIDPVDFKSGFYNLTQNDSVLTTLAFNNSNMESRLRQLSTDKIVSVFEESGQKVNVFSTSDMQNLEETIKEKYLGVPLWKYAIMIALIFLLLEILIIRFVK